MKLTRASGALGLVALAVIASPVAQAAETGWYIGASAGQSRATIDDEKITSSLLANGLTVTSISDDERDTGFKILGGYQFSKYFALEGGYFDLGEFGFIANTVPAGTLEGRIKLKGVNVDAVGTLPLSENFSAIARFGVHYTSAKDNFVGTGGVSVLDTNPDKDSANVKYGLGLQYAVTKALALRLEAERFRINDAVNGRGDVDLVSIGLIYRFGKTEEAPPKAAAPAAVAATPPIAVIVVAVVPPKAPKAAPKAKALPLPSKVAFSSDSFFDFDQVAIRPAGKEALDQFAAELKETEFEFITVTGHTDRIGTKEYNQKLSLERAETVKHYLVTTGGIPANKIHAVGVNESDPVTNVGDCVGSKSKEIVKCLQPDRRVVVDVEGTQTIE